MAIIRNKDVRSGKPVIEGTRVTVGDVVDRFYRLGRSGGRIASDLSITEEDVEDALRYYYNEMIERERETGLEA